jgi:hypothetical protein
MKSIKNMTTAELAAFIESHLLKKGIYVVLSGDACVSIYSSNKYVSMDLDLVNVRFAKRQDLGSAIQEIGFREEGRHFRHPDTELLIEFPPGPLAVGEEPVKKVDEHKLRTGMLRIISPTDCVKDRLAGYYHWNDLQCLEQACLVADATEIDLKEIERWSKIEGKLGEFKRIRKRFVRNETQTHQPDEDSYLPQGSDGSQQTLISSVSQMEGPTLGRRDRTK